jgi:hypothetical protein
MRPECSNVAATDLARCWNGSTERRSGTGFNANRASFDFRKESGDDQGVPSSLTARER